MPNDRLKDNPHFYDGHLLESVNIPEGEYSAAATDREE